MGVHLRRCIWAAVWLVPLTVNQMLERKNLGKENEIYIRTVGAEVALTLKWNGMDAKLMIILCGCAQSIDDNKKYFIAFISSLTVALILVLVNNIWDKHKRRKAIVERLLNEIYVLCEKIMRYALHANQRALSAKYFYAMHKADRDENFDQTNYSKYLSDAESSALAYTLSQADLIGKIGELENYWNSPKEIKEIKEATMGVTFHMN